jgi:hypothetical protein
MRIEKMQISQIVIRKELNDGQEGGTNIGTMLLPFADGIAAEGSQDAVISLATSRQRADPGGISLLSTTAMPFVQLAR